VGESFEYEGWSFEIMDTDGRRIDRIVASRLPEAAGDAAGNQTG